MAKNPEDIELRQIVRVEGVQNDYIDQLAEVHRKLLSQVRDYLGQVPATGAIDAAMAAEELERIITSSGYYRVAGDFLNDGYKQALKISQDTYRQIYGESLRYQPQAMSLLQAQQASQLQQVAALSNFARDEIAKQVMSLSFGAQSFDAAVEQITNTLGMLERDSYTWMRTSMAEVHRTSTVQLGEELGITRYRYYGPDDKLTRPFCAEHLNEIKTLDDWKALPNGQIGTAATNGGGYNCRHRLVPVGPANA